MLATEAPSRSICLMRETGILATTLPELDALPTDALDRALAALDEAVAGAPGNERLALAALLGEAGADTARSVLERLRVAGRDNNAVTALIADAPEPYSSDWTDADVRRYMGRVRPELLDDLLALRAVRAGGDDGARAEADLRERIDSQRAADSPLTLADLTIDGRDLRETLGLPEGPAIGTILERLLGDVIEDPSLNARMTLLTRASLILDELVQGGRSGTGRPPIR